MRQEKATSRTEFVEEEQFLFLRDELSRYLFERTYSANLAMVPLGSFLQKLFVLGHLLGTGEGDTVHTL